MLNKKVVLWGTSGVVLVILGLGVFASAKLFGNEKKWICANGQWTSYGHPNETMPTSGCGEKVSDVDDTIVVANSVPKETKDQTVKVFFNNIKFDPALLDCSKVYPVNRTIKPTLAVAHAALEELFKGLAPGESELGYLTNVNKGVKIQKLAIENGIAKVDFSEDLEKEVGGSCRTAAIIAQIKQTLEQFPTIKDVVISIDGRTEDILQP